MTTNAYVVVVRNDSSIMLTEEQVQLSLSGLMMCMRVLKYLVWIFFFAFPQSGDFVIPNIANVTINDTTSK